MYFRTPMKITINQQQQYYYDEEDDDSYSFTTPSPSSRTHNHIDSSIPTALSPLVIS